MLNTEEAADNVFKMERQKEYPYSCEITEDNDEEKTWK